MKKSKKGFTLVEMVVVMALVAVFGAIVLGISVSSGKLFSMAQKVSYINDDARLIIGNIEDDLRRAKSIEATAASPSSSVKIKYKSDEYTIPYASTTILAYTVKVDGIEKKYAFAKNTSTSEVCRYELITGGTTKNAGCNISNVKEFTVVKDSSSKGYKLNIKIDDGKNNASYNSIITPRN